MLWSQEASFSVSRVGCTTKSQPFNSKLSELALLMPKEEDWSADYCPLLHSNPLPQIHADLCYRITFPSLLLIILLWKKVQNEDFSFCKHCFPPKKKKKKNHRKTQQILHELTSLQRFTQTLGLFSHHLRNLRWTVYNLHYSFIITGLRNNSL